MELRNLNVIAIVKCNLLIAFVLFSQGCTLEKQCTYFNDTKVQNEIDKGIDSILTETPSPTYVKVFFAEFQEKTYVFITGVLNVNDFKSKYYFHKEGKDVLIGYQNLNLEKRFANSVCEKPESVFNNQLVDIFDGTSITYEIDSLNNMKRISPTDEIWESQFANVEPLVEPPLHK